jgi:endogenous inhibitor of DNA gyrase (YacG/DUF329 family)
MTTEFDGCQVYDYSLDRPCDYCGEPFLPTRKSMRFCCHACEKSDYNRRRRHARKTVACTVCGAQFTRRNKRNKYCSAECGRIGHNIRWRERHASPIIEGTCLACGEPTVSTRGSQPRRYCSVRCKSTDWMRRRDGRVHTGAKVKWEARPGLVLEGKVQARTPDMAAIVASGTVYEVSPKQLKVIR